MPSTASDFRVAGKIFATLAYPNKQSAMVKLTPMQQEDFVKSHPAVFNPCNGAWGRKGCTNVLLAKSNKRALKAAILAAWRNFAPSEFVKKSLPLRKKPSERRNLRSGDAVVLVKAERGLLAGLPRKDQNAIKAIVGKPIRFVSFDEDGRAELEFREKDGTGHFIYVRRDLVQATRPGLKN